MSLDRTTIIDAVCVRIANGESLLTICDDKAMPNRDTIYTWMAEDQRLSDKYARACELRTDRQVEEMIEIARRASPEDVQVAKLQIDTRKWVAAKMMPKKYGDKIEATVVDGNKLEVVRTIVTGPNTSTT